MREHMILHVGLFGKASITHVASEGPSAIMSVHVTAQIAGRTKRLATLGAAVGLLTRVRQLVVVEIGRGRERFATQRASVRLVARVYASMSVER